MAGLGTRFSEAGYEKPKPLIDVDGIPMIAAVVNSLNLDANYIFIVQKEHSKKYNLESYLVNLVPNSKIIEIDGVTDGAARTTLAAKSLIDNDSPLIIANSDQIIVWDSLKFLNILKAGHAISLFYADSPKWSYAKIKNGLIIEVAEKVVISDQATTGIYGWRTGADYVKYAEQMINKNIRTNNEFYICPVYNEAIQDNQLVFPYAVDRMFGIGTPEDLDIFLKKQKQEEQ